ncbi:MAG TPA: CPBP family intramembrane glutamic endopeptidase [Anaerolineales bacterium]
MNLELFPWGVFIILSFLGLIALSLALPLSMKPLRWLLAIVILLVLIGSGLVLASQDGFQASALAGWLSGQTQNSQINRIFGWALIMGVSVGLILLVTLRLLSRGPLPQLRSRFADEVKYPLWKRLVIAFYSGILEEIIFRLFLLSLVAWLLGQVWQTADGHPATGALWLSNVLAALLFGLVHLPRWSNFTRLSPGFILLIIAMNGLGGIAFGYLFLTYGIEAAIIAHFIGDSLLHVIGPNIITA